MNLSEKELLLNQVEHKIGMIKAFHNNDEAQELVELYDEYNKTGASYTEIKLFLEDLDLFLEVRKN
jgi:hypothetical protein